MLWCSASQAQSQTFVHPGGLHTLADLDRMKAKVAAGEHPWIDSWNILITDAQAQNTYTAAARANMGSSRQRADADAHAAYLNALRWYISGDTTYAECAVRNLNAWSAAVNQVPTGTDIPGLSGIPIFDFGMAAELLRIYPGWAAADFDRFKSMMLTYFYPVAHGFLTNHNGACISAYWSNWDISNIGAILTMGVLCDDTTKYNEAIDYFKNGAGMGSMMNAVPFVYPGNLGQWQESGRDQEHAQLAVGMMASICQVAWNQGLDLYGYDNNRLLAGAEYVARTNLWQPVPYTAYNNCDNANQLWVSVNGRGRLDDRPLWELVYNHYVVRKGLSAPNTQAMAHLVRPERGSADHFGYGTLAFTLDATASPYPPSPIPPVPTGLTATAGVGQVTLNWTTSGVTAKGYTVQRSTTSGGPYTTVASWTENTTPQYTDATVTNGTTYYYVVAANNQAGTSGTSTEASATPAASGALPAGWARQDVGTVSAAGSASYASVSNNTFIITGSGTGIGGTADSFGYTYGSVTGDFTITARLSALGGTVSKTGIMMRESLAPDAKALVMKLGDAGWRQAGFGTRSSTGGSMTWVGGNDYTWVPAWFRLQRSGNTFTAYQSSDGITWFTIGTSTVAMSSTFYVGMFACSGSSTGALDNSTFDNVITVGGGSSLSTPTGLAATAVSSNRINLSWKASASTSGYQVKRATTPGGPYTTIATGVTDTTYSDTGLAWTTTYYYVVSSANLAGESANSVEASATTQAPIVPPTPKLTAAAGDSRVVLGWNATTDATTYNVKRATVSGGPYTTIASPTTTTYIDLTTVNGTTYYYVVSAANITGESANSAEASAKPAVGAYSYWAFDETSGTTALDSWGNRNGTLASGATLVASAINNGVKLDGTANGYVTLPTGVVSTLNDFSISAWVKLDVSANWARIFDFGSGTGVYMFLTPSNGANGTVRYEIYTGSGAQQINSSSVITTGLWTHLAVTQSGTVGILYVNGMEVGRNTSLTLKPSSLGNTTQNWIGRSQFSADPKLTGIVDDFRIYSRALSASEISSLIVLPIPPVAPTSLSATAGNNQITLNWTAPAGATSYKVKRATAIGGPYTVLADVTTTSYIDTAATNCTTYFYTVSAVNSVGESPATSPASPSLGVKLTGTLIGTSGSFGNVATTTKAAAVDGNLTTFFDAPQGSAWVGYDLGANGVSVIKRVRYVPRINFPSRMVGGVFQGANTADFSNAVTLFAVTAQPAVGVYTEQILSNSTPYRYVRYLSPSSGFGNVAEVEFYGLLAQSPQIVSATTTQNIVYGTPFSYTIEATNRPILFSAAGLPDGLSLNTCTGIISGAPTVTGTYPVIFSPSNAWGSATDTLVLVIKQNQTITFNVLTEKVMGDADFSPATASSDLPISYSSSDSTVATIVNGSIHLVAVGTATITATQPGNDTYNPASPVIQLLTVIKRAQTIAFPALPAKLVGEADFNAGATSSSGLPISYSSSDTTVATIMNGLIHIVGAGSSTITASQVGNATYLAAATVSQPLTVTKRAQTITFNPIATKQVWDADFDAGALASSGLSVSYSSSNPDVATIVNGLIHLVKAGTTVITATQAGDHTYLPAADVSQSLTVQAALKVQYLDGDNRQPTNNTIKPYLKIVNGGSIAVPYSELKARYWFTAENYAGINTWIDYAALGISNVKMKYVALPLPRNGALGYVEYSFTAAAGTLAANGNSGIIQSRLANVDYAVLNEADDYSYLNTTNYTVNDHLTLYRNGKLIYGTEPAAVASVLNLKVYSASKSSATNTISTYLKVNNEGNLPVAYQDFSVRYWFTSEGTSPLNYWIDYAKLGAANVTSQFVRLSPALSGADAYLELKVAPTLGTLYPLSSTGDIQYHLAKADWSNFNQTNDYSYLPVASFAENNHITVYYQGQLVYGTEPTATSGARLATEEVSTALQVKVIGNPVQGEKAEVEVRGAEGLPLELVMTDLMGRSLLEQQVEKAAEVERQALSLSQQSAGVYLLRVRTSKQAVMVKVIKP